MSAPSGDGSVDDTAIASAKVVAGCCGDKPHELLWRQNRFVRELQRDQLLFNRSVFGGVSGSPVLMEIDGTWTVVGVQRDGDFAATVALRITEENRQFLERCVRKFEP